MGYAKHTRTAGRTGTDRQGRCPVGVWQALIAGANERIRAIWHGQVAVVASSGEDGQGLVEYALIILMIAIACAGALVSLGSAIDSMLYDQIIDTLLPAMTP